MDLVLEYAASELDRVHQLMNDKADHAIKLVVSDDFIVPEKRGDPEWDDAYRIDVHMAKGQITGVNARSVLLGVYRYFSLLGCVFYAPGKGGEIIPYKNITDCSVEYTGMASYRHRGICIEGSDSLQNILDIVDWAPKLGFNSYFIQFREGHNFFERWYKHESSTVLKPEEYSVEKSRGYVKQIEEAIRQRGLIYHKTGHGWTCECLGYPSTGWHKVDDESISEDTRSLLAQVNGKRGFFGGVPLNTHLCYSNPEARRRIVDEVVKYAESAPQVDVLHFWLADNYNNICECENCQKSTITDFYVSMLNDIDARLTAQGIITKMVFLIYLELMWEPVKEKINNPGRFIMMFAPISRTYTRGYLKDGEECDYSKIPCLPYTLNKIELPKDVETNLGMLFRWKKHFQGDSFVFDYHLMWDIYRDLSGLDLAKVIHSDAANLHKLGLNGMISCQVNRAFFPSGFCMYVMGRTLFDKDCAFDELTKEYFTGVYGKDAETAHRYLEKVSELLPFKYLRGEDGGYTGQTHTEKMKEACRYFEDAAPLISEAYDGCKGMQNERAWKCLRYSAEFYKKVAEILVEKASGADEKKMKQYSAEFEHMVWNNEMELQPDLDAYYFSMILKGVFEDKEKSCIN